MYQKRDQIKFDALEEGNIMYMENMRIYSEDWFPNLKR